jgi:hypothetical protein
MAGSDMTILDFIHTFFALITILNFTFYHDYLVALLQVIAAFLCVEVAIYRFMPEPPKTCTHELDYQTVLGWYNEYRYRKYPVLKRRYNEQGGNYQALELSSMPRSDS